MAVPLHPSAIHPLTPGTHAYAILKVGAIGGLIALRMLLVRRARRRCEDAHLEPETVRDEPARRPHPVSRRKARKRRKR